MCGIAGAVGVLDPVVTGGIRRARRAQRHRGPDASGSWSSCPAGQRGALFAHNRLSILDLSPLGHQPMVGPRGHALVFNGEIYNYRELKRELETLGAELRSRSDTEVVLRAFETWGEGAIDRFRGMFALAFWDPTSERVLMARDRFGIKPLYYTSVERPDGRTTLFASEVRALLSTGLVRRQICPLGLRTYLWNGVAVTPNTLVRSVRLLPEATFAWVGPDGEIEAPRRYFQLPRSSSRLFGREAVDEAGAALREAISQHLLSDVPVGVFLSGGVDSSAVAALAAELEGRSLRTFNLSFDEREYDESRYALAVAEALGTDHVDVRLREADLHGSIDEALGALDQPSFDGVNTYFVSRAVRSPSSSRSCSSTRWRARSSSRGWTGAFLPSEEPSSERG